MIRGWFPPGFRPPQVTILSAQPPVEQIGIRLLGSAAATLGLSADAVFCWHGDIAVAGNVNSEERAAAIGGISAHGWSNNAERSSPRGY